MRDISNAFQYLSLFLFFIFATACGGKGTNGEKPTPPAPEKKEETDEWNKDRTLGILLVSKLDGKALANSGEGYKQIAKEITSLPRSTYSWVVIDGTDEVGGEGTKTIPAVSLQPAMKGHFGYFNLQSFENGVAKGAYLFTPRWSGSSVNQAPLIDGQSYLLTLPVHVKGVSEKLFPYDLTLGYTSLESSKHISAFEKMLSDYTSIRQPTFLMGTVAQGLKSQLSQTAAKVGHYSLSFPEGLPKGSELFFILAPKEYKVRATDQKFSSGGVKGMLISVESGVKS